MPCNFTGSCKFLYSRRMPMSDTELGLRERKNRRTRRAIVQAATELILEIGYDAATIPRIAERADVSPRTVSTWFPAKDDIFFDQADDAIARATRHLRDGSGDTVDRIQQWLVDEAGRERWDAEITRLREAAITHDPELRARAHRHLERVQSEIAAAAARDVGGSAQDVGPQIFAGAAMGFLFALRSIGLESRGDDVAQQAAGIAFLRGGLAAIRSDPARPDRAATRRTGSPSRRSPARSAP
jgi:AcrR family transcriptional regulator